MYISSIMEIVVSTAEEAFNSLSDEIPICSIIAIGYRIVSVATNNVENSASPFEHAEFLAVLAALKNLQTKYLETASLYTNLEPCSFCAASLEKVRIKNIFFGAYSPKTGSIVHGCRVFDFSVHKPNIMGGFQAERCEKIITEFFRQRR
jgi:tRNA(adenine34) deaminase